MALKVGDLYVSVSAAIGEALKSLGQLVDAVEKAAREVKNAGNDMGEIGAVVAAGIGAAVAAATESNEGMKKEVQELTDLVYTLAADLGDLFAPVVEKLADFMSRLVANFQRLSPEVKSAGAEIAVWVAGAGLAMGAVGKLAGVVEAMAGTMGLLVKVMAAANTSTAVAGIASGFASSAAGLRRLMDLRPGELLAGIGTSAKAATSGLGGLGPALGNIASGLKFTATYLAYFSAPLVAIAAAVAALTLLAGSIYGAWTDTSTGVKDSVLEIFAAIGGVAKEVWEVLSNTFDALGKVFEAIVTRAINLLTWLLRTAAENLAPIADAAQQGNIARALRKISGMTGEEIVKAFKKGAAEAAEKVTAAGAAVSGTLADMGATAASFGKEIKQGVAFGVGKSFDGTKQMFDALGVPSMFETLKALFTGPILADVGKPDVRYTESRRKELAAEAEALEQRIKELGQMQARAAAESAEELRKQLAAEREAAEESFRIITEETERLAEEAQRMAAAAQEAIKQARQALVDRAIGSLGKLGDLFNSAMQGFQAGGVYGAIIAVVAELLASSKGFADAIGALNGLIQSLADGLGTILEPAQPLLGALKGVIDAFFEVLTPVFEMLNAAVEAIAPPLVIFGKLLEGLAPMLSAGAKALTAIMDPLNMLAGPAMEALFEVLKFVSEVILKVSIALGEVWNAIIKAIQWVLRQISKAVEWLGIKALKKLADSMEGMKADTDAMRDSLSELQDTTWQSARDQANHNAEVLRGTKALEKMTEALTNVPAAWKVALRRFASQDTQDGPKRPNTPTPPPTAGNGPPRTNPPVTYEDLPQRQRDREERERERRGEVIPKTSLPGNAKSGPTYNVTINGVDAEKAVDEALRFAQRTSSLHRLAEDGRSVPKGYRFA
ncbi:hypothetical protein [Myxococcus landrumensis]|uniref:Uncharacterized protein n=1 Tax=Myxococcus landrumensis TaxID=2813577 RepID=A0ABX7NEZ6_9BACT|nr:hypothetical protein [Myxococcus landrumus]QSQ17238.1 hypothetical protein JY572_14755 [Myxococcus landrumus]